MDPQNKRSRHRMMTEKKDLHQLTDEALLVEKKKLAKSKVWYALAIGFLAGILIFGVVSWALSPKKQLGFLIPMSIPIVLIYRLVKTPNRNKELEDILKKRGLA